MNLFIFIGGMIGGYLRGFVFLVFLGGVVHVKMGCC